MSIAQTSNTILQNRIKWLTYNNSQLMLEIQSLERQLRTADNAVNALIDQFLTNTFTVDSFGPEDSNPRTMTLDTEGTWAEQQLKVKEMKVVAKGEAYSLVLELKEPFSYIGTTETIKINQLVFPITPDSPQIDQYESLNSVYNISGLPILSSSDQYIAKATVLEDNTTTVYSLGTPAQPIKFTVAKATSNTTDLKGKFVVGASAPIITSVQPL